MKFAAGRQRFDLRNKSSQSACRCRVSVHEVCPLSEGRRLAPLRNREKTLLTFPSTEKLRSPSPHGKAERRAGHRVGRNSRAIVVNGAGDQSGPERLQETPDGLRELCFLVAWSSVSTR